MGFGAATYFPGHRQINFNQSIEILGQSLDQLRQNNYNSHDAFNRYKGAWAEDQFKSIIRTLINLENAYNRRFRISSSSIEFDGFNEARIMSSPIDKLNIIFATAGLLPQFTLSARGLTAFKSGVEYEVEALSDGERASLFIPAGIITQDRNSVLLIDEPEKHLHPSITGILVSASLRANPEVCVVLSSHDITLLEQLIVEQTVYVRGSDVLTLKPETRTFDVEVLAAGEIPEKLRLDILGARAKILYIEGTESSRDAALYARVYSGWKVVSKGSSKTVIEATRSIRKEDRLHWLQAFGIIDRDGQVDHEIQKLERQGVFVLKFPTVENLFFLAEAQQCFVNADLAMRSGSTLIDRQLKGYAVAASAIDSDLDEIIARRTLWRFQREVNAVPVSVRSIKQGEIPKIEIDLNRIGQEVSSEIHALVAGTAIADLLIDLPIKNTNIPDIMARALGASSFKEYCSVIQRQIDLRTEDGMSLIAKIASTLPELPN